MQPASIFLIIQLSNSRVKGASLTDAAKKAARFVKRCILKSEELNVPVQNGVCFEEVLSELIKWK